MDKVKAVLSQEATYLKKAIRQIKVQRVTRKQVVFELVSNGVAAIITFLSTLLLQQVFVVRGIKNLWGIAAKKDAYMVSKDTFEWLNWLVIFLVGLVVFTVVEQIMEKYLEEREK